jgi:hypothetical protein
MATIEEAAGTDLLSILSADQRSRNPEHVAETAIRAAAPADWQIYANVAWLAPTRPGGPPRDGEADLVIVVPQHGILVIETKGGRVQRDSRNRSQRPPNPPGRVPLRHAQPALRPAPGGRSGAGDRRRRASSTSP